MGVSYTKVYQDATTLFNDASDVSFDVSNPVPAGLVEQFGIRIVGKTADVPSAASMSELISSLRLTFNGDQIYNMNTSACSVANAGQSRIGAVLDDIGGFIAENPSATDQDMTLWIPCGINLPMNSRFELSISYITALQNITDAKFEVWFKYGKASNATILGNATSQTMSAGSQVMMTVKIPSFKGATVSGVILQNPDNTDTLTQVIVKPLGDFAMSAPFLRGASGASQNGYQFVAATVSDTANQYASGVSGYYFVPCYDLTNTDGSITLLITANDDVVYTAIPVLSLPTGGSGEAEPKQTASKATGSSLSILQRAEE